MVITFFPHYKLFLFLKRSTQGTEPYCFTRHGLAYFLWVSSEKPQKLGYYPTELVFLVFHFNLVGIRVPFHSY